MEGNKISILFLVTQLERAGAQTVAFSQARHFHRYGHDVTLCFLYDKQDLIDLIRKEEPYRVIELGGKVPNGSKISNMFRMIRSAFRLYKLLRHERIQVIETITKNSNILGIFVAWLARVPIRISSEHLPLDSFSKPTVIIEVWMNNSSLTHKRVVVSEKIRQISVDSGMFNEKLALIQNGIDVQKFSRWGLNENDNMRSQLRQALGISDDTTVCITVARIHRQKGHRYLIEAAKTICEQRDDILFLFVGDGELRSDVEALVHDAGLANKIRFLGVRADIPQLLHMSDLFVLPSIYEAMPMTILEAMAARLPVVATSVHGNLEVVIDGVTGVLVPPADPALLGDTILSLLEDRKTLRDMGSRGFDRVSQHFSEQTMCERYESLIMKLLNNINS